MTVVLQLDFTGISQILGQEVEVPVVKMAGAIVLHKGCHQNWFSEKPGVLAPPGGPPPPFP